MLHEGGGSEGGRSAGKGGSVRKQQGAARTAMHNEHARDGRRRHAYPAAAPPPHPHPPPTPPHPPPPHTHPTHTHTPHTPHTLPLTWRWRLRRPWLRWWLRWSPGQRRWTAGFWLRQAGGRGRAAGARSAPCESNHAKLTSGCTALAPPALRATQQHPPVAAAPAPPSSALASRASDWPAAPPPPLPLAPPPDW